MNISYISRFWRGAVSVLLCGCALALCTLPARGEEEPEQARKATYRLMQRGDEAQRNQQWAEAVRMYRAALTGYHELAMKAEKWEEDYYRFRIEQVENELTRTLEASGKDEETLLKEDEDETELEVQRMQARYQAALEENAYLRRQIEELEEELDVYREREELGENASELPRSRSLTVESEPPVAVAPRHAVPVFDEDLFTKPEEK